MEFLARKVFKIGKKASTGDEKALRHLKGRSEIYFIIIKKES